MTLIAQFRGEREAGRGDERAPAARRGGRVGATSRAAPLSFEAGFGELRGEMPISMFVAKDPAHLDRVFKLRHQVYIDEEQRFAPRPDGRMFDRFDAFETAKSVLAVDTSKPDKPAVGTLRYAARHHVVGSPADAFYDFSDYASALGGGIGTIGMLAVGQRYRMLRGLVVGMVKIAIRELRRLGCRHVLAPVAPDAESAFKGMGARQIGEPFHFGSPPVLMTPMHADLEQLAPMFREMSFDPRDMLFEDIGERRLYRRGEVVITEGETGAEAFLVMRGVVRVYTGPATSPTTSYMLGPGEIFGELALLAGGEHPATIEAHSRMLDLGIITREQFQLSLSSDVEFAQRMLKLLGERIRKLLTRLPPDAMTHVNEEENLAHVLLDVSENGTMPVKKSWLAMDCGMNERKLEYTLRKWKASKVITEEGEAIIVRDPKMLQIIVDHVMESYALPRHIEAAITNVSQMLSLGEKTQSSLKIGR